MLENLINNAKSIIIFTALNNHARFVGGCVRDSLLKKTIKDIDIATTYLPEETMALLKSKGIKVVPTGIKHGTVTAIVDGQSFEITTLRRDLACDGRHAQVEFTDDWQADASRRDFTINAMYADIEGKIYDFFDGQKDLKNGVIRFVGDAIERCEEDILRILRFFRFNAYYGRDPINSGGLFAAVKLAHKVKNLSAERIQTEMLKLLSAPNPVPMLTIMDEIALLKYLLPTNVNLSALEQLISLEKTLSIEVYSLRRLVVLIKRGVMDIPDLNSVLENWRLSNKQLKYAQLVIFPEMEFAIDMTLSHRNRFIRQVGRDLYKEILLVNWAEDSQLMDSQVEDFYRAAYSHVMQFQIPQFPISGNDLKLFGIKEGREMGKILKLAEQWWEASGYEASKKEILAYIRQMNFII